MNNQNKGILLLSHCGFSFMEDLITVVHKIGLESYVLSSQPISDEKERSNQLFSISSEFFITNEKCLTWNDIESVLAKLKDAHKNVIACISVWEGYREFMSRANHLLGANDLSESTVSLLRDKFLLRRELRNKSLSRVNVENLNKKNFENYRQSNKRMFIKPRTGIASYGAIALDKRLQWDTIEQIKNDIRLDQEYLSIFNKINDFIIEDYIEGNEYSFEILVFESTTYIIAIHEKVDITAHKSTVLESACISPPLNLSRPEILNASKWIEEIFSSLNIDFGCYHVEAKLHDQQWEIIEINPRIGGSFISDSVELITGESLLTMWVITLIVKNCDLTHLHRYLARLSTKNDCFFSREHSSFFRAYFANRNGVIKQISVNEAIKIPEQIKILAKSGSNINCDSREVFIGQALWRISKDKISSVPQLLQDSKKLIEVIYE